MKPPLIIALDSQTFDAAVLGSGSALVDFGATRCPPCRALEPVVEAVALDHAGRLRVARVDVDAHPELAARYGVRSIPVLLAFRDGAVVGQIVGAVPRSKIDALVQQALGRG